MMFTENLKRKYALSDKGAANTKKGMIWTVVVNLTVMGGMGILYLLMERFMLVLTDGGEMPKAAFFGAAVAGFALLSLFTHFEQYHNTYSLVYGEVRNMRLSLAKRLRVLPLSFFGKRINMTKNH